MAKRKQWTGPFQYKTDGTCVKCDKRHEYFINVSGITLGACRKHAIEAACSREGGKTLAEATLELDEIDRERWRQRNTFKASWVPVTEQLPDQELRCLVFTGSDVRSATYYPPGCFQPEITHWMPLPAPPTDAK